MCDQWMSALRIPMTLAQFHQLPRHPAYKYEYLTCQAWLTPRPKFYHARLDLAKEFAPRDLATTEPMTLAQVQETDFDDLKKVFRNAFSQIQPFAGLDP